MSCNGIPIFPFIESLNETHSINPCTGPRNDFFLIEKNDAEPSISSVHHNGAYSFNLIPKKGSELEYLKGCCSTLSPILQLNNLKVLMDVMRLSIGTTIPHSPRYSNLSLTNSVNMIDMLFPLEDLAIELENRYIQFKYCVIFLNPFYFDHHSLENSH